MDGNPHHHLTQMAFYLRLHELRGSSPSRRADLRRHVQIMKTIIAHEVTGLRA
jgi:hypothetical protein